MTIKKKLIGFSKTIGIDQIRFCSAKPFFELQKPLIERKEKGYMCELEGAEFDKKIYPELTMKDAKTFIVITESYTTPFSISKDKFRGNISASAIEIDYHELVMKKLKKLEDYLLTLMNCHTKCYVDISPFSDRSIARRAGVGFIGKNSMLISKTYGSKIFIGYILTDLYIETDSSRVTYDCLDCNRCVKACPTGAILGTGEINSNRCISYLTQSKKEIPSNLKEKMGTQIYGCDRCQYVCPYNEIENNKPSEPVIDSNPSFEELLSISNKEFKLTYGLTASGWRGKKVFQRNAIIGLGNSKDREALRILEKYIYDERKDIRKEIILSIQRLGFTEGIKLLDKMQKRDDDADNKELIIQAINRILKTEKS